MLLMQRLEEPQDVFPAVKGKAPTYYPHHPLVEPLVSHDVNGNERDVTCFHSRRCTWRRLNERYASLMQDGTYRSRNSTSTAGAKETLSGMKGSAYKPWQE